MKLPSRPPVVLAVAAAAFMAAGAQAQIYRSVDAQGQVTFTDTPDAATEPVTPGSPATPGTVALPYELRQVQARYPVTLYASPQCAPCELGRKLLTDRGIPFAEKAIITPEDAEALQRLTSSTELPVLSVGTKPIQGYEQTAWTQYLDAAGYSATSRLPAGWQPAPPVPLVAPAATPVEATQATAQQGPTPEGTQPEAVAPPRTADNPAGIRF